jgi:hypothetical protein
VQCMKKIIINCYFFKYKLCTTINKMVLLKMLKVHILLLFKKKIMNVDYITVIFDNSNACGKSTMGMNPKANFGDRFRNNLWGIIPSASRDCSTYQFRYAFLSELEFHE